MMGENREQLQKELIWALEYGTDLTQGEIADHPMIKKSQPTVSRILDEYDPALDGTEFVGTGYGRDEDIERDGPPVSTYREALAEAMLSAPGLAAMVGMAESGPLSPEGD
ncbi:hypothetical protein ACYJ1Y_18330 [Natrialbaceae archaeon A-gly3]